MMKLNKTLTVFVFFASVAFMGFAIVTTIGGPNWRAMADELEEFSFSKAGDDSPWSIKRRDFSDENVGSAQTLPEGVSVAQTRKLSDQQTEIDRLDRDTPVIKETIEQAQAAITADLEAMHNRQQDLDKQLRELTVQIVQVGKEADAKTQEAQQKYDLVKLRRQESLMLNTQLKELRAQRELVTAEAQRLRDLLVSVKGNLERAHRRQQLLEQDVQQYDQ